jgi:nucleoid DNA-binding protein
MKREALAHLVAEQTHVSNAQAKDRVEELVCEILRSLRKGRPVNLPGICKLAANPKPKAVPKVVKGVR